MKRKLRTNSLKTKGSGKIELYIPSLTTLIVAIPIILLFFFCGLMFGSIVSPKNNGINSIDIQYMKSLDRVDNKMNLRGAILNIPADAISTKAVLVENESVMSKLKAQKNSEENTSLNIENTVSNKLEPDKSTTTDLLTNSIQNNIGNIFSIQEEVEVDISNQFELPNQLELSLHATSLSYMIAPNTLDSSNIIIGAWIYLDELKQDIHDMRTIFSNKKPGCDKSPEQYGFSLFVNAWQSNDMKLHAEYGGHSSGCNKIDSGDVKLVSNEWHHVALSLSLGSGMLFIDNELVGTTSDGQEVHQVQTARNLLVGQFDTGEYPFRGNISHLVIVQPINTLSREDISTVISSMMSPQQVDKIPGVIAYYPLKDAVNAKSNDEAMDMIFNYHGKYQITEHVAGHQVNGVKVKLVDGTLKREITEELINESNLLGQKHADEIKETTAKLWKNYRQHAWGYDELKPLSKRGDNNWGGMSVTLVDSLDTLYIMGLENEFNEAVEYIESSLTYQNANTISVFETTIRVLGGLLSAYGLSKKSILLNKAIELGQILLPAFNTGSGIPQSQVNVKSHQGVSSWSGSSAILSELGSLQIEFRNLAYFTNNNEYEKKSMKPLQVMYRKKPSHGLFPIKVSISDGSFTDSQITFGALGDSFYEYLLKVWIQGNRRESWLREMYDNAVNGIIDVLLQTTVPNGYSFLADYNGRSLNRKMDHLACFMAGVLALGAYTDPLGFDSERAKRDLAVGKALMYTCYQMYHMTKSGISAEYVEFPTHGNADITIPSHVSFYILRPEVAESLFVLGQITKDPIYREWSWEIYEAIAKHCRTESGTFGALRNVQNPNQGLDDRMESFFIAETLKYLYLAQDPNHSIDLLNFVFNTEAHPTRIFDDSHEPVEA